MLLPKEINNYVLLALAMLVQFWAGWRFYKGVWDAYVLQYRPDTLNNSF
jgi:cation transport ATPase